MVNWDIRAPTDLCTIFDTLKIHTNHFTLLVFCDFNAYSYVNMTFKCERREFFFFIVVPISTCLKGKKIYDDKQTHEGKCYFL